MLANICCSEKGKVSQHAVSLQASERHFELNEAQSMCFTWLKGWAQSLTKVNNGLEGSKTPKCHHDEMDGFSY